MAMIANQRKSSGTVWRMIRSPITVTPITQRQFPADPAENDLHDVYNHIPAPAQGLCTKNYLAPEA